jgi:hypothetical protein
MSAQVEEMSSQAQALAETAVKLQEMVGRFHLRANTDEVVESKVVRLRRVA